MWQITADVERFASLSAAFALEIGHPDAAAEAARQGLLAVPGSPGLWRLRIQAAEAGSGENVEELRRHARRETGSEI